MHGSRRGISDGYRRSKIIRKELSTGVHSLPFFTKIEPVLEPVPFRIFGTLETKGSSLDITTSLEWNHCNQVCVVIIMGRA